ncbi:uncharacterized protein UDID_18847 [Ustilago sp. UG-2017a]|nr:uncharacterized protein UDID_18847 [Ustilago sp. UG-2017a]
MSKMGERSNLDTKFVNNGTPPAVDIEAIQLAALLAPHDATAESDIQQCQQVEAKASDAANLARQQVFQHHRLPALPAADPHNIPEAGFLETSMPNGPCRLTIKLDNIGTYDGSTDGLGIFLSHVKSLIESHQDLVWEDETDLLNEIHYGLPASLQLDICTHLLSNPNMNNLLTELRNLEGPWKATLCSGSQYNSPNDPLPPPLMSSTTYSVSWA